MKRIEFEKVSVNPMAFFDSPLDIVHSTHFTTEQKLKLLLAWQYDDDVVTALGLLARQSGTKHGTER
jgi:hypothetical protein